MPASRLAVPGWRYIGDCVKNRLQLVAGKAIDYVMLLQLFQIQDNEDMVIVSCMSASIGNNMHDIQVTSIQLNSMRKCRYK